MSSMMNSWSMSTNNIMEQHSDTMSVEESGRGCRSKRKQLEPARCPVCSVTLRVSELDSHLITEIDKLTKISVNKHRRSPKVGSPISGSSASNDSGMKGWDTYQKVKSNRQGRLKVKSKKRKTDEVTCPVCNKSTNEDITLHVEMCLQRMDTSETASEDENIDVEGDDGKFEEYEWAGQMRVRASSLLEGGFTSLGMGTSISKVSVEEEDTDVIVDGDDTHVYGLPQYTEQDITNATIGPGDTETDEKENRYSILQIEYTKSGFEGQTSTDFSQTSGSQTVMDALKSRIRELETRDQNREMYKCLICMGVFKTPVVSVCCWHVHCEQCWLQTLASKKLCPQCNMITSPLDFRRIYI